MHSGVAFRWENVPDIIHAGVEENDEARGAVDDDAGADAADEVKGTGSGDIPCRKYAREQWTHNSLAAAAWF